MTWNPKPATVEAFTEGDCWALAIEIRRLTGYPLIFSTMASLYGGPTKDFPWDHVAVMLPNGNALDILGPITWDDFQVRWGTGDSHTTGDDAEITALTNDQVRQYPDANPRATARRLTNHFNIPTTGRRHRDALPL